MTKQLLNINAVHLTATARDPLNILVSNEHQDLNINIWPEPDLISNSLAIEVRSASGERLYGEIYTGKDTEDGSAPSLAELPENLLSKTGDEIVLQYFGKEIPITRREDSLLVDFDTDKAVTFNRKASLTDVVNYLPLLANFIPEVQLQIMGKQARAKKGAEEGQFFRDKLVEMGKLITGMPKSYEQDGLGDEAVAYLHYFGGSIDIYITEKDVGDEDGLTQNQAFGFSDLGGGGELGYVSIEALRSTPLELDLHFTPITIAEIKAKAEQELSQGPQS